MHGVAAVVVTYNRRQLLARCLEAIRAQTAQLERIYVIDNASTDGTAEMLDEAGFLEDGRIELCRLPTNTGSAGGFHAGMRRAYEAGHAWLWLMDDDGYPAPDCLERLLAGGQKLDVVGPAVVLPEEPSRLTWPPRQVGPGGRYRMLRSLGAHHRDLELAAPEGIYPDFAALFNGVLVSRRVPAEVGFVLADLFIWGDENEYLLRCRSAGFRVGTCTGALHFHPYVKPRLSSRLKFYHLYRNSMYIERLYFRLMHPAWLRPIYPLYLSLRMLGNLPSFSPSYLLCLLHGARRARRGELVPFPDKPRAGAVATVGPETA